MNRSVYPEMLLKQKELLKQKGYDFDVFQSKSISERYNFLFSLQEEYLGHEKPINHITPVVSVCIPTYQHYGYIRECIEGALMQQTSFPFEIVIGDDGSVDGTTEICMEYAEKYPNKIRFYNRVRELCRVFDLDGHIERSGNWWWTLQEGRGKYMAICEGDDYWIDPLKLQKQVDFLENNPEYVLSHGSIEYYYQSQHLFIMSKDIEINAKLQKKGYISKEELLSSYRIQTVSVVFRNLLNEIYDSDPFLYKSGYFLMGDTPLWYGLSQKGKIHFLKDVTAVYRKNNSSATGHDNMKKYYRFVLSMAELRLYLAMRDNLSCSFKLATQKKYHNSAADYLAFDPSYNLLYPLDLGKVKWLKKGLYKMSLLKYYLLIFIYVRSWLGNIRRMVIKSI